MAMKPVKGITIISKLRTSIREEIGRLLLVLLKDKVLAGDNVADFIICQKVLTICDDLIKLAAGASTVDAPETSRGWFYNFKKRTGIYSVVGHGDAAKTDVRATDAFV